MDSSQLTTILFVIQKSISVCGAIIILMGILRALIHYFRWIFGNSKIDMNTIRLNLGLVITLGLEFIVAADLIGTTTAPDYYTVGILASIVLIRTLLSYTINREISSISPK